MPVSAPEMSPSRLLTSDFHRQPQEPSVPLLSFTILNTNDDQVITVNDLKDPTRSPIWNGALNHNDSTPTIQCWKGSDDKGRIEISGSVSSTLQSDVRNDGDEIRY
jgi:hypothetical protein